MHNVTFTLIFIVLSLSLLLYQSLSLTTPKQSFSILKIVKISLRSPMIDEWHSVRPMLHIHKGTTLITGPEDIVAELAKKNGRIRLLK